MAANTETESGQGPIGTWLHDIGAAFDPAIFIAQLFGFAVILFLLWKYVRPPVAKMMRDRQETVRQQLADSAAAAERVAAGLLRLGGAVLVAAGGAVDLVAGAFLVVGP